MHVCAALTFLWLGYEAAAFLASGAPADVMLLDIRMPGPSGVEIMRDLQQPPPFPVLAMTGHVDRDAQSEFRYAMM